MPVRHLTAQTGFLFVFALAAAAPASAHIPALIAQITFPSAEPTIPASDLVTTGQFVTAPIVVDGQTIFRIAAPLTPGPGQMPIATRAANIQNEVDHILDETSVGSTKKTVFDPHTLRIHIQRVGSINILQVVDAKHPDPLPILTVTANDAEANSTEPQSLTALWSVTLQSTLAHALWIRQPAAEAKHLQRVGMIGVILISLSLLVSLLLRMLRRPIHRLEADVALSNETLDASVPLSPEKPNARDLRRQFLAHSLDLLKPARRLRAYSILTTTVILTLILSWILAITWSLSLFDETIGISDILRHDVLSVLGILIGTVLLNKMLDIVIDRSAIAWSSGHFYNSEDRTRLQLRIPTIARALVAAKAFVLVFIAVLSGFTQVGFPVSSVITIGSVAAIAISLAAQNFVRDFLNGFLVLYEDQYVAGDYITINGLSGSVEVLTLRIVQLRDVGGNLITIPHSSVVTVLNQSRNWSRIDFRIPVDAATDTAHALTLIQTAIEELATTGTWTHRSSSPLEWLGIESLNRDAIVLRASIRTAPLQQFALRRQINDRVRQAFLNADIILGAPPP